MSRQYQTLDERLACDLLIFPQRYGFRWSEKADHDLRRILFRYLSHYDNTFLKLFFPNQQDFSDSASIPWSLSKAQGAVDGAEYLPSARGTACGHIFKTGESTYACKTCAADDTCVLCTRCFESSDHDGHQVFVSISPGNSGCCDCGDHEAWKKDVICSIHTDPATLRPGQHTTGKAKEQPTGAIDTSATSLPHDLVDAIRTTISRAMDFLCDVFSCSPEQMRLAKTEATVRRDEEQSRLSPSSYGAEDSPLGAGQEFCLLLWNDEKHTIDDVMNQVARACSQPKSTGRQRAVEVNDVGRSIVYYSTDIKRLIQMASVIEQLKLTVTIRSARDTFREQMCAAIIDWLADISGCSVGSEPSILRNIVCEEMLKPWKTGSRAGNKGIGLQGIDDHEEEDNARSAFGRYRTVIARRGRPATAETTLGVAFIAAIDDDDDNDNDNDNDNENDDDVDNVDETDDIDEDDFGFEGEDMDLDITDMPPAQRQTNANALNMEIELVEDDIDVTEVMEARHAGYPAPPPPPRASHRIRNQPSSPNDSEDVDTEIDRPGPQPSAPFGRVPRTPRAEGVSKRHYRPGRHWTELPEAFSGPRLTVPCEDLWQRIRLDWLVLYDLRLWKTLRINLRHLYITTVVVMPQFKRILGLRFAGLYTPLAELYLIADREPDHSIINLSVQMLTTPTITEEVVERGNFLSNLMAILYTFLTTRQVGYPEEVNPKATLAFDAGTVTNRRMFHFFLDLRWLFHSDYVRRRMRVEYRYLLQFLELVKLHQGICPNVRAVGEHVEYESDAWISASLIIKEVNKLCRQIAQSFEPQIDDTNAQLHRALRTVAQVALCNTLGFERKRFTNAEIKAPLNFHVIGPFTEQAISFKVPKHVVQKEHISFHHPLHYLLSWLIEYSLESTVEELKSLLTFSSADFKDPLRDVRIAPNLPTTMSPELLLTAIFDPPLRVCAWLAQTKAGMWVRNGITLRHQANAYRSVTSRDIGYQRDIFLIQTGLTLMSGVGPAHGDPREDSYLAQMVDRFQMAAWMQGDFAIVEDFEEAQQLDVLEDFYHLLVIALSERSHLVPRHGAKELTDALLQHDIAHALCFKPLSYSDITSRVTEKVHESDDFNRVLESMATYKAPEGLSDTGVFELRPEYIELIDPYFAHYTRNAREEAETIFRRHKALRTGQKPEEVVYEPRLQPIGSGLFKDLAAFTRTGLFVQVIFAGLQYSYLANSIAPNVPSTRIETFLHMVLHLLMIAVAEDRPGSEKDSFILLAARESYVRTHGTDHNIFSMLQALSQSDECSSCHPTINHILSMMRLKQPAALSTVFGKVDAESRSRTDSPASLSADEREKKKLAALARQARVMAQMKEQQNSFLQNQGLGGLEASTDLDDFEDKMSITQDDDATITETRTWPYPVGTCILCQEATDDSRMYGTFAFVDNSNILRSTPVTDDDYVAEVLNTPENLDQAYTERPFGVSSNKLPVFRTSADGTPSMSYRQRLSKGFAQDTWSASGPVSTSCGHMMHFKCFEVYCNATNRRHQQQIARNHPENVYLHEFICPLCKALGNTFLPIVWKSKECADDTSLSTTQDFDHWLEHTKDSHLWHFVNEDSTETDRRLKSNAIRHHETEQRLRAFAHRVFPPHLLLQIIGKTATADDADIPLPQAFRHSLQRSLSIGSIFRLGRNMTGQSGPSDVRAASARENTPDHKSELAMAYNRAYDSFNSNGLVKGRARSNTAIDVMMLLSHALGLSISTFEISQRGSGASAVQQLGLSQSTLINTLSEQTLTHLRVLSETAETALALSGLDGQSCKFGNEVETTSILLEWQNRLRVQLFGIGDEDLTGQKVAQFSTDSFLTLVNWIVAYNSSIEDALQLIRLCLWAEMVKCITLFSTVLSRRPTLTFIDMDDDDEFVSSANILLGVQAECASQSATVLNLPSAFDSQECRKLRTIVRRYALTFLRKCLVLMHVRYGMDFDTPLGSEAGEDELIRISRHLRIEDPFMMFQSYSGQGKAGLTLRTITRLWIHDAVGLHASSTTLGEPAIKLPHPAIFELIGLPTNYDALTEEAIRRRCPTTGKEVTDPAICLFCGEIFCSQAVCCMVRDDRGGCSQHMQRCGLGNTGMFINIRKCMVLLMHGSNGSFLQAPYLDKHGEPDPTLRRHHQLFLNQKRYDKLLRDVWLAHGIQNVISRKLEADINPGGWETL